MALAFITWGRFGAGWAPFDTSKIGTREETQLAAERAHERFGLPVDVFYGEAPPPEEGYEENPRLVGWIESKGAAGRSTWTRDDGLIQIRDAAGRAAVQRYQVLFLQRGSWQEDIGWPSLAAAVRYAEGRSSLRDHPLHRR